jgi:hypothetical protein
LTPKREQFVRRALWSGAILVASASVAAGCLATLESRRTRPLVLELSVSPALSGASKGRTNDIDALRSKRMSRAIAKVVVPPPPPPPKPPTPPLETLIRLSGIMSFGKDAPKEAFIETKSTNQTKGYKAGDALPTGGIKIKSITDVVIVSYDEKDWKLTDRGAEALPVAPLSGPGMKE